MILDIGVTFNAFDRVALVVEFERLGPEGHVLIDLHMVSDTGGFADDDSRAMIDEEVCADLGTRMDVRSGAFVGILGHHPRQERHIEPIELMR